MLSMLCVLAIAAAFIMSTLRFGVPVSVPVGEKQESWLLPLDSAIENLRTGMETAGLIVIEGFRLAFIDDDRSRAGLSGDSVIAFICEADGTVAALVFGRDI